MEMGKCHRLVLSFLPETNRGLTFPSTQLVVESSSPRNLGVDASVYMPP